MRRMMGEVEDEDENKNENEGCPTICRRRQTSCYPSAALNTKHKSCCFDRKIDRSSVRTWTPITITISMRLLRIPIVTPVHRGHTQTQTEREMSMSNEKWEEKREDQRDDAWVLSSSAEAASIWVCVCVCVLATQCLPHFVCPLTLTETNHCCANKKSMHCLVMSCCVSRHVLPSCKSSVCALLCSVLSRSKAICNAVAVARCPV